MVEEEGHRDIVFLLGAGASIKAGVPDTFSFVGQFIERIEDEEEKEAIETIIDGLKEWKKTQNGQGEIDIELLLETLMQLNNRNNEAVLQFYNPKAKLDYNFSHLIKNLKNFIKQKAIVPEDRLGYLQPLIDFIEEMPNMPLDIISLNYDICIEQFCNIQKLIWKDGFDVYWNQNTFINSNSNVNLYKLHGSVMWYKSDIGDYIKLPVMTELSEIQLITGERAENLMLYPMQKWDYVEPIFELLLRAKALLESKNCRYLIAIGYSFRDDHVRDILWDSARKNKEIHLIIVDPNAYSLYENRLKYYNNSIKTRSSLFGKVICLPYKFEDVLPFYLKNYYLNNLRSAMPLLNKLRTSEISGYETDPREVIEKLANAEFVEKVEELLPKLKRNDGDWKLILNLSLKMALNLSANNQMDKSAKYLKDFYDILHIVLVERISAEIRGQGDNSNGPNIRKYILDLMFNYQSLAQGYSAVRINDFRKLFDEFSQFCDSIKRMSSVPDNIKPIDFKIKLFAKYFASLESQTLENYKRIRSEQGLSDELDSSFSEFDKGTVTLPTIELLKSKIIAHEKALLENIFSE